MLNQTGITKTVGTAPVQILFNVQNQMAVSIKVNKSATGFVTENGRKILKAGTPLSGNLENRATAFTNVGENAPAVGILLHDVDITDVNANASLLIWGFVNLDRLSAATAALITSAVKTSLAGKVWFLKDN